MKKVLIFLSVFVLIFTVLSTVNIYAFNPIPDDDLDNPSYDTYCLESSGLFDGSIHSFIHKLTNSSIKVVDLSLSVIGLSLDDILDDSKLFFRDNFILIELIISLFVLIIFLNIFRIIIWSIIDFIDNKKRKKNDEPKDILRCKYNKILRVFQILGIIIIIFFLIIYLIPEYYFPDYSVWKYYGVTF